MKELLIIILFHLVPFNIQSGSQSLNKITSANQIKISVLVDKLERNLSPFLITSDEINQDISITNKRLKNKKSKAARPIKRLANRLIRPP